MPVSSPMPASLPKECAKATQIFNSFASIIPQEILRGARGFAILTIAKAGFLFSARAGSGLVIVKLANGSWSAPSAVGTGGLGVGGQAGAELSEFVIILNSKAAVQSFMSNGSINLGGNLSVAVGPIGRNAEASGSINKFATMYSYSRTKGLFGGASLEGSVIFERSDSNTKAYRDYMDDYPGEVNARMLLSGAIQPPAWAQGLINAIERRAGTLFDSTWVDDQPSDHEERRNRGYSFGSEHAAQSNSSSPVGNAKLRKNRRSDNAADDSQIGDEEDPDRWSGYEQTARNAGPTSSKDRMAVMANQFQGRLRGYSLGSFGKGKAGSGSSTPTKKNARERSYSSATPRTRFEEDGNTYFDDAYSDNRKTNPQGRGRGFSDALDDIPASPTSTSASAKVSKITEMMMRPVMPARKSTSSVQTMSKNGKDSLNSGSRWIPNIATKKEKNRLQYSGRYDSDEDRYDRNDDFGASQNEQRNRPSTDSPFGDQFNQVEHRFSSELEDDDGVYGYRDNGKEKNGMKNRFMSDQSRPPAQRSSTAPVQNNAYRSNREHRDDDDDGYGDVVQFSDNKYERNGGKPARASVYAFSERFDENTARQSFDSLDQQPSIAVFRHTVESDNPFDESTSAATAPIKRDNEFFTAKESRDLLSSLDEELPLSSSYSDVERPTHRLDSRQFNRNGKGNGRNANGFGERYDDDNDSIRSIDSTKEYMVVGQKAHRVPLKVTEVQNDLMHSPTDMYQTDTSLPSGKKEWRIATFDFEGGQAQDLSFKTGDIIEVIGKDDPDWWTGRIGLQQGIIPVNRTRPHTGQA